MIDTKGMKIQNEKGVADFHLEYKQTDEDVEEFINGYKLKKFLSNKDLAFFLLAGTIGAIIGHIINEFTGFSVDLFYVFMVCMVGFMPLYLFVYRAVNDRLSEKDLSRKKLVYHYLAQAVEQYNDSDFEGVYETLSTAGFWLEKDDFNHLHNRHEEIILLYVDHLEDLSKSERSETIEKTFKSLFVSIINQINGIEESDYSEVLHEFESTTKTKESKTPIRFLLDSLTNVSYFEPLKGIIPFLCVGLIGFVVFYTVNQQLAMFLVIVLMPAVQYITNRDDSD